LSLAEGMMRDYPSICWTIHHRDTENTESGTPGGHGFYELAGFDMVFDPGFVQ
jgi:hypothetical protein